MEDYIAQAWYLLENRTPLPADCGRVCGRACCRGSAREKRGMRLFPGDQERLKDGFSLYSAADGGVLAVCGEKDGRGHCDRSRRPLACRLFPLFPHLDEEGRIRAVYDPRAWRVCPLVREHARVPLNREFVRAVRTVGRLLTQDEDCRRFLREQSREIEEVNRFLRLHEARAPICRKAVRR